MSTTPPPSVSAPPASGNPAASPAGGRRWLLIASGLALLWILFLLVLAIWYANPVTLNRRQVLDSDLVIEGRIRSLVSGEVEVTQTLFGTVPAELLKVTNLSDTGAREGEIYLLPLVHSSAGNSPDELAYQVTPTGLPHPRRPGEGLPLIYPQSAEILQQLRGLYAP